jgi:hypothetical protein
MPLRFPHITPVAADNLAALLSMLSSFICMLLHRVVNIISQPVTHSADTSSAVAVLSYIIIHSVSTLRLACLLLNANVRATELVDMSSANQDSALSMYILACLPLPACRVSILLSCTLIMTGRLTHLHDIGSM